MSAPFQIPAPWNIVLYLPCSYFGQLERRTKQTYQKKYKNALQNLQSQDKFFEDNLTCLTIY